MRKPSNTFAEAMERSHGESNVEEYLGSKMQEHRQHQKPKSAHPKGRGQQQARLPKVEQGPAKRPSASGVGPNPSVNQRQVFLTLGGAENLPVTRPMGKDTASFRDANRYCEYHQDTGHTTQRLSSHLNFVPREWCFMTASIFSGLDLCHPFLRRSLKIGL